MKKTLLLPIVVASLIAQAKTFEQHWHEMQGLYLSLSKKYLPRRLNRVSTPITMRIPPNIYFKYPNKISKKPLILTKDSSKKSNGIRDHIERTGTSMIEPSSYL